MTTTERLEGLAAILEKQPIIPTYKARDFWDAPQAVEHAYELHVRSYIPLARGGSGEEDQLDVGVFERSLTRLIRDARAPLGYVTAEFGHGKTSTGLFLWDRARKENILAVPPFSFDALADLVTAVAGWVRFAIERVRPGLGKQAEDIYASYRRRGLDDLAREQAQVTGRPVEQVRAEFEILYRQDKLKLGFNGLDYVNFLQAMTELAKEAGYQGLLVIADEVQQYIEHEDVRNAREPIADLFDIVTTMYGRSGRLACGLIFLLPHKELGLINDRRGDLVQRIKNARLALDLTQVYGSDFALRLWERLSTDFNFAPVAARIIAPDTLAALGEIAARTDLASGPRTVVDVFKIVCQRYIDGASHPFSPVDLVTAFEHNEIAFDGTSKIQSAVRHALTHDLVRGRPDMEDAVRLMAAFPTTGLTEERQKPENVRIAVSDLQRLAVGELVALRGGGFDHQGRVVQAGVTLMALRPSDEKADWLKETIRTYRRNYYLGSERIQQLALAGFHALLVETLFPSASWKIDQEYEATALTQNHAVILRGSFPLSRTQFPERLVYCRLLAPLDTPRDPLSQHDLLIDFALTVPLGEASDVQRRHPGQLTWLQPNHARVELNLLHHDADANYLDLNPGFQDIVAPYDVNPLLVLSLYAALKKDLDERRVPGKEESTVRDLFLPALLNAGLRDLFHAELGKTGTPQIATAEVRFVETLFVQLCERTYGKQYKTLMVTDQWQSALRQYRVALGQIDHPLVRSGQELYTGSKKRVADLFGRTNAAFDNFQRAFPDLVKIEEPFRGDNAGAVRFALHPLETRIRQLVNERGEKQRRMNKHTNQTADVPVLAIGDIRRALLPFGYRTEEIETAIDLLEARRLMQRDNMGQLIALEPAVPQTEEVAGALKVYQQRLQLLKPLLEPSLHARLVADTRRYESAFVTKDGKPPLPHLLISLQRELQRLNGDLDRIVQERGQQLKQLAAELGREMDFSRLDASLAQPATGGLFVDQLNMARVALQRELSDLRSRSESIRMTARESGERLEQASPDDAALVANAQKLNEARNTLQNLHTTRDSLQRRVANYGDAQRLLVDASSFYNDKLLRLGSPVDTQRQDLDRWNRAIVEALMTRRIDALAEIESWRARLQALQQEVAEYERGIQNAFAERQQQLRRILTDNFKLSAGVLEPPLVYNPLDREGSYRLLEQQFRREIGKLHQRSSARLDDLRRIARTIIAPDTLSLLPDENRAPADVSMRQAIAALTQIEERMQQLFTQLAVLASTETPAIMLAFAPLWQGILETQELIAKIAEQIQSLRRLLQETALTPAEEQAYKLLLELAPNGEVDMVEFQQRVKRDLGAQDAWEVLRALSTKSRVRVRVQVLRS